MMIDIEKVVNEQSCPSGSSNVTNTSFYSAGFTATRDFVAYLTQWNYDGNSTGG